MARADTSETAQPGAKRWRWTVRLALAALALMLMAALGLWLSRERIAGNLIDEALSEQGLEARYDIAAIGPDRQVLENLVIGDPAAPDFTARRLIVQVAYGWGSAEIGAVRIERPRLFGSYRDGVLSFGALDKVLFAGSQEPPGLPPLDITIVDGGARIESDFGDIGAVLSGSGRLDDGFEGVLAATAPGIGIDGCTARSATLYGALRSLGGGLRFEGPVRVRGTGCEGASLARADLNAAIRSAAGFEAVEAEFDLAGAGLAYGESRAATLGGDARVTFGAKGLRVVHDLTLGGIASPAGTLAETRIAGGLRSDPAFAMMEWDGEVAGSGADFAALAAGPLASARIASAGTLLAPLIARLQSRLPAAAAGGDFSAQVDLRSSGEGRSLAIPQARVRGGSGETLLAVSRANVVSGSGGAMRFTGNFVTGGEGLPRIAGRMERSGDRALNLRLTMAEYASGGSRLAIPELSVRQRPDGSLGFTGNVAASGAIPGGSITGLELPLNGAWSPRAGLALGNGCETVRFRDLRLSDLALRGQSVRLCPVGGRAMVRYGDGGLAVAAATTGLALSGTMGKSPASVSARSAVLRYPGTMAFESVAARIGAAGSSASLTAGRISGALGEDWGGTFENAAARIDAVPLNLDDIAGQWRFAEGRLAISQADLRVSDRIEGTQFKRARFEPLKAQGATLILEGNSITAEAALAHARRGARITDVTVQHDLATGMGEARLAVPGIVFGDSLSLPDLTYYALGVVASAQGVVRGEGLVRWTPDDLTSTGALRTDGFDLAAAFGPIRDLRGEVRFSDLIGLTTEPGQTIRIGSINPGIEALGGTLRFAMEEGTTIRIEDARWPFMGGELVMRPTTLRYGTDEEQSYVFEVTGLDAATFVAEMELANLAATGTFDGHVPIIFDVEGNGRIEGGALFSRPPGGNVSYIGELTYEDMGAITNYAFQALRSLDYRRMSVDLDGDLAGEIITRFGIDGVRQGAGAQRNFITRRLAGLPIRFNVNVRSENFYELATMVRTFWDPDALGNPVDRGLLGVDGQRLIAPQPQPTQPQLPKPAPPQPETRENLPDAIRPTESTVQPSESEGLP